MVAVRCWCFRPCGRMSLVRIESCVDGIIHVLHRSQPLSMGMKGLGTSLGGPPNSVQPLAFVTFLRRESLTSCSFSEDLSRKCCSAPLHSWGPFLQSHLGGWREGREFWSSHPSFWGTIMCDLWDWGP